jgi:tRNA (guanine37-N1)-methyltransferase
MRYDIVTVFPDIFDSLGRGIVGRAIGAGKLELATHDLRDHGLGAYRQVDDSPYGGGAGMILRVEPIIASVREIQGYEQAKIIVLSAAGTPFTQAKAEELSGNDHLILICGRYEGIDARVTEILGAEEISIGPYVLSGGEIPAMVVVDAVSRLLPGVLGNEASLVEESHDEAGAEYPQYTRPEEFEGHKVPDVLLSGNHAQIEKWRSSQRRGA